MKEKFKNYSFLILGVVLILIFICIEFNKNKVVNIGLNDLKTRINNSEKFILFVGSDQCQACFNTKETLNKFALKNNNIKIFYININGLNTKEREDFLSIVNFGESIPKIYLVKDKRVNIQNFISGWHDLDYMNTKINEIYNAK